MGETADRGGEVWDMRYWYRGCRGVSLGSSSITTTPPLTPVPFSRRDYVDISIAVATPKGLVVPVLRNANKLSFAGIEKV